MQAVISGNGGCGLCTPKETGSSIAAEYLGIPAVTVAAPNFVNQVYSTAVNHGVPAPRAATYPGAFSAHTPEELVRNTREVVWPQIVAALTKPITEAEIAQRRKASVGGPKDRVFADARIRNGGAKHDFLLRHLVGDAEIGLGDIGEALAGE